MLIGGALLRQFKRERMGSQGTPEFRAIGYQKNSYASVMAFYKSFGLEYGWEPGEAAGNSRYIPITRLKTERFYTIAREGEGVVGLAVEAESQRIARVLTQKKAGDLVDTLTYSLREIFRNVVEHSGADCIWYAAQYWPTKNKVEIGILDEGVGIRAALSKNAKYAAVDDHNALHLALQPGVSGVARAERDHPQASDDPWANSGYGLYMTSAICQRGGCFAIASGRKALFLENDSVEFQDTVYSGTAIRMVLDTSQVENLTKTLDKIRRAGEKLARTGSNGGNLSASMISRMLARTEVDEDDPGSDLCVGCRVVHPQFGPGTVLEITDSSADARAQVLFDEYGTKRILLRYANLQME